MKNKIRQFKTGATRDKEDGKLDLEGFLNPYNIQIFGEYMHKHRLQQDGTLRASDNWQKGMPKEVYMKSLWRHFHDLWLEHRGYVSREGINNAICGIIFNSFGYLYEENKRKK
jgi:hypothetical protein